MEPVKDAEPGDDAEVKTPPPAPDDDDDTTDPTDVWVDEGGEGG